MSLRKSWPWFVWSASFVICLSGLGYVLLMLPLEAQQGFVQKIFFLHVPSAFAMYLGLLMSAVFSGLYLWEKERRYDHLAHASMRVALLFCAVVLVSGPLWAKPIWGVYWDWDPRLTTTFVVFVLIVAYLSVRRVFERQGVDEKRTSLVCALIAIFALLDVPLIHFSVKLWRGLHPSVLRNPDGLPPAFRTGLELMSIGILLLAGLLIWIQFRILQYAERTKHG